MTVNLTRRSFIFTTVAAGGGMLLGFHIPKALALAHVISPQPWKLPTDKEGVEVNAWLTISPDGIVTIRVPHTEQGQGALTSVPMMVAEELDVDWKNVRAVFADPNRHLRNNEEYVTMSTSGSNVVRSRHPHIMQAGASARERLKEAAARAWGVERADVVAKQGVLTSGNHSGTYGEFATAAAEITLPEEPKIKTYDQWWLLGKPTPRLDVPLKVNGSAAYAIDTSLPDMVYASVKCCPVPWGKLKSFDFDAIKSRPGVIAAIELKAVDGKTKNSDMQNGVAVVADSWYRAKTALEMMPIEWDFGASANVSNESLFAEANRLLEQPGEVAEGAEVGPDPQPLIAAASKVVTAQYQRPYETHARMEPINATAHVQADRIDVWAPSQDQAEALELAADQAGFDTKDVYVHTVFIGGAFGGGGGGNTAVTRQATEISRQVGRPVKVVWTREEDMINDKQRPINVSRFSAAIGEKGLPTALFTRSVGESNRPNNADSAIRDMPYLVPSRRHERHAMKVHIPTASHRAPGTNQNGFMTESFVDEIALAGGWDPLDWRIEMTKGLDSWQLVLKTLKEKAGFRTDLPKGEGMGVAIVEDHESICAACATVTVSRRGSLRVEKVVLVIDSGHIINPLNCEEQLEGAMCWELSHAWLGGLDLQNGRFVNNNFDSYNLVRIDQMPEVEVHYALSRGEKWGGMGEPGGPPTPPAVANAIFFATGKRLRSTPFKREDLRWS